MSEKNVELVRESFERVEAGDSQSWRNVFASDVIWDTSASQVPDAGFYHGHEGMEHFMVAWLGAWQDPVVEHLELIDAGDSVVAVFHWSGRGKTSGVAANATFFGVYEVSGDQIVRYRQFDTRAEALQAAGLQE